MQRIAYLLFFLLFFQSCTNGVDFEESEPIFRKGDDLSWASKTVDQSKWYTERGNTGTSVFWARINVNIKSNLKKNAHLGMEVYSFGAFEVYWDGVKIGQNGRPALGPITEIPGTHTSDYLVPDSLSKRGNHILALRATQQSRSAEQRGMGIKLEYYPKLIQTPLIMSALMNLMAGAFLIASLYYLFLFLNGIRKNYAILIFSLICFLFFALLIAEYIKFYIAIPYTHFYFRLEVIGALTFATALLIPLYFSIQFNFKWKKLLIGSLLGLLIALYIFNYRSYDLSAKLFSACMWTTSILIVVSAIYKKEKGGVIVFLGLITSMLLNFFIVYDFGIFICFTIIVLCMLYLHTIKTKEAEKAHESSLLLSSRLKLELVKKNIQPHFIKNTLTSLIDWIEESPTQGVVFIKALAEELDILNEIADSTLIPITTEIALCKAHLTVMHFRKEITYHWEEINIEPSELIPPAILHTLLENGITHSLPLDDGSIRFVLEFNLGKDFKTYTLTIHAKNRPPRLSKRQSTGFKYIAARLAESYGDSWKFESTAVTEGWRTHIKIETNR